MATDEALKLKPVSKKYNVSDGESGALQDDSDYDPHLHRNVANPTTNTETLIHMLKGALGTGILAMPEAFKNSGLWNGVISTIFIGIICTYCLHVLVKAQYVMCKRLKVPILTYPNSMKIALEMGPQCLRPFANFSAILVDVFLILYQLGICCVYVLFVAVNIKSICDEFTTTKISVELYMLMTFVPFVLINSIRNLKLLAPWSTVANVLTFICFGIVCYYVFQNLPSIGDVPAIGTAYHYPLFFGTTLFALEAVGVVIALENNMKTPKSFGGWMGVLNISMVIITFLYIGMGFLGYWRYGDLVEPSITLNFEQKDILAKIVKGLYSTAIFISYGLQGYVPVQIMWDTYIVKRLEGSNRLLVWEYLLRIVTVAITFVLAITIPLLGLFISLFGAFCLSALGIAFPAIMDICVKYPNNFGPGKWYLIKDVLLIIFGLAGLLAGSFSAISEIVIEMSKDTK